MRKRLALLKYSLLYKSNFKYGKKFYFREGFSVVAQGKVEIGDYVFFNKGCSLNSKESITVGDNTIFGENVIIIDLIFLINLSGSKDITQDQFLLVVIAG